MTSRRCGLLSEFFYQLLLPAEKERQSIIFRRVRVRLSGVTKQINGLWGRKDVVSSACDPGAIPDANDFIAFSLQRNTFGDGQLLALAA